MLNKKIFSKRPYEKIGSSELVMAVKKNQLYKVQSHLKKNRFLVYDYDYYNMVPKTKIIW